MSTDTIVEWPLEELDDSPFQPRNQYDQTALEEGAATMRPPHGRVHQPIVARMVDGRAQIVFGHQRTRMARLAGLTTIPTIFREMTDEQVKVAQIVENLQRTGVTPLDEADAMHLLRIEHQASIEDLMERCGKSRSYVYNRLRLATASSYVRMAVAEGQCDAEVAQEVARLPSALQQKALDAVSFLSFRSAKAELRNSFQFNLARAPFDTMSIKLLPAAGACDACPKRSDAEPVLLEECGPDVCMDGECYGKKAALHREAEEKKAAKAAAKSKPAEPALTPQQAWPFPQHRPSQGSLDIPDATSTERAKAVAMVEPDDHDDEPEMTEQQKAVSSTEHWRKVIEAMCKAVVSRPLTTDDLRFLLERELDLGDGCFGRDGDVEQLIGWNIDDTESYERGAAAARLELLPTTSADHLGALLVMNAIAGGPCFVQHRAHLGVQNARIAMALRFGIDPVTAEPLATELAPTPSPAARAPKKAKAAQAKKKAKAEPVEQGEEDKKQIDDAGSAGERDPNTSELFETFL